MTKPLLEVCTADFDSVRHAVAGGATRIELCAALSEGGLTPSPGLLTRVRETFPSLSIQVLIRPRGGDFHYTADDIAIMRADIRYAREQGADGVVIGALTPDGSVDLEAMRLLIIEARPMEVTFHRAFDLCRDPSTALEDIIDLGCDRLLTSGRAASAEQGIAQLCDSVWQARGRLTVMPGGGVTEDNAARILRETGASQIHASARSHVPSTMTYRHADVSMGTPGTDEYSRLVTDIERVRTIIQRIQIDYSPQKNNNA